MVYDWEGKSGRLRRVLWLSALVVVIVIIWGVTALLPVAQM